MRNSLEGERPQYNKIDLDFTGVSQLINTGQEQEALDLLNKALVESGKTIRGINCEGTVKEVTIDPQNGEDGSRILNVTFSWGKTERISLWRLENVCFQVE